MLNDAEKFPTGPGRCNLAKDSPVRFPPDTADSETVQELSIDHCPRCNRLVCCVLPRSERNLPAV